MARALPIAEAARELRVRPGTLRRWIRQGAPVAQRGCRGRGHALLVDVSAVKAWHGADARDGALLQIAAAIPEILAATTIQTLQDAQGVDKRKLAGILAASWYLSATATLDRLRELCAGIPEISSLPESIARLKKIARE